jgi:holin-like protein
MFKNLQKPAFEFASGVAIIWSLLWVGSFLSRMTGQFLPGSIIGMLLLTLGLEFGWIQLNWVQRISNLFLRWMSLLFVPIGVGLIDKLDVLQSSLGAILVTCIVVTLVLLALIGWGVQWFHLRALQRIESEDQL